MAPGRGGFQDTREGRRWTPGKGGEGNGGDPGRGGIQFLASTIRRRGSAPGYRPSYQFIPFPGSSLRRWEGEGIAMGEGRDPGRGGKGIRMMAMMMKMMAMLVLMLRLMLIWWTVAVQ